MKSTPSGLTGHDLSDLPNDFEELRQVGRVCHPGLSGISQFPAGFEQSATQRYVDQDAFVTGLTSSGFKNSSVTAWTGYHHLMAESLDKFDLIEKLKQSVYLLMATAELDPQQMQALVADEEFLNGARAILKRLMVYREKLLKNPEECYKQDWDKKRHKDLVAANPQMHALLIQQATAFATRLISVFEFMVSLGEGDASTYVPGDLQGMLAKLSSEEPGKEVDAALTVAQANFEAARSLDEEEGK